MADHGTGTVLLGGATLMNKTQPCIRITLFYVLSIYFIYIFLYLKNIKIHVLSIYFCYVLSIYFYILSIYLFYLYVF